MDPSSSESSPPLQWRRTSLQWTKQKSFVGQSPYPPPYQSHAYPGPPHPESAYPPQPQGYGAPPQYGMRPDLPIYGMGQQNPAQPGIVTVQPIATVTQAPLGNPVKDYLGYSIFTMLCCCLPLGIAALICSISVRDANVRGDRVAAEQSSSMAMVLNNVALGFGLVCFVSVIGIVVAVVLSSS